MSQQDIIRAWKDAEFGNSLSEDRRSQLPENPAGIIEMSDAALEVVGGGGRATGNAGTGGCESGKGDIDKIR